MPISRHSRERVQEIVKQIKEDRLSAEGFSREIQALSLDELRHLGREFLNTSLTPGIHVEVVRAELIARAAPKRKIYEVTRRAHSRSQA